MLKQSTRRMLEVLIHYFWVPSGFWSLGERLIGDQNCPIRDSLQLLECVHLQQEPITQALAGGTQQETLIHVGTASSCLD